MDPSGNFFQFIIAAIIAIAAVAAATSIATGVASLIASATGHERAAERLAKVSQVSAYVSTPLMFVEGGGAVGAAYLISGAAAAAASDPVASAFSGPSFSNTSPSPLQHTAAAVGEYAIGVGITTAAFAAAGAALRPAIPWLKKAAGPTLRKFAARWGPKLGRIRFGAENSLAGQAAKQDQNIALGLREHLYDFAKSVGGSTWEEWAAADPANWRSAFTRVVSNPANRVSFNLTGVDDPWLAAARAASGGIGATDWELLQVQSNPQWWNRITFFKNGKIVSNPYE